LRPVRAMRGLCAAAIALSALSLAPLPAAYAESTKPGFVRVPAAQGFARSGPFLGSPAPSDPLTAKRVHKRDRRADFVRRGRDRRRPYYVPTGYYYGPAYPYQPIAVPSYPTQASTPTQSEKPPPVTPKWVHVGDDIGLGGPGEGAADGSGLGHNCLSVKTQITVDGAPVDAFGEACLLADGSWKLQPSKQTD
jgi:hypothetical protein